MQSTMMNQPLLISSIMAHATKVYPEMEIVSRLCDEEEGGKVYRYKLKQSASRAKKLSNALLKHGINQGDRVATLAWNNYRHYELYFGVTGIGAIIHTVNPRLFIEQITYILNHAEDKLLFVDITFINIIELMKDDIKHIEKIVVLTGDEHLPQTTLDNVISYEAFIEMEEDTIEWPEFDENIGAILCYTSGTTGNPKGVLYSHRSTVLHSMSAALPENFNISSRSSILAVVPMFHVNAWGIPFFSTMLGAKLVLPGQGLDPKSLYELIDIEQPTIMFGVPTVWLMLLDYLSKTEVSLSSVDKVIIGGSAAPLSMIKHFKEKHNVIAVHAWGMTEMSPMGTINNLTPEMEALPSEECMQKQLSQGRPAFGVELKLIDDKGNEILNDGKSRGHLLVRGPWVTASYYNTDSDSSFKDGWLVTGDIATLDSEYNLSLVDRAKDVIKSGGEWISSIDLENAAIGHLGIKECCVIGVKHEKWDERPILLIVKDNNVNLSEQDVFEFLAPKIAKWWMPDAVIFVDELPYTATGKLLKMKLREEYQDYLLVF
ncbi:MAG: acyl-CoA synthetase (AMP-forming)/AMP-acid ligase II [Francisellaceae bacterium]|jgi:acyl-CoA synthetase (AMP-forming)/AMP-acid ligase II